MAKKKLTAQEKLQLVIESFKDDVNTSELCRKQDIWPTELNRFKQRVLEGALKALIPHSVFKKAPTAELRPNQRDEDSLPPPTQF